MKLKRILELGYYPVASKYAKEGAQIVNGQWYIPRWGCDTLQHIIDVWEEDAPLTSRSSRAADTCTKYKECIGRYQPYCPKGRP